MINWDSVFEWGRRASDRLAPAPATPKRDQLREYLRNSGIPSEIYYPSPLHLQPAFADLGYHAGAFPESEEASQQVLALPIFPMMSEEQQNMVVDRTAEFFAGKR